MRNGDEVLGNEFLEVAGADKAEARLNFVWGSLLVIVVSFEHGDFTSSIVTIHYSPRAKSPRKSNANAYASCLLDFCLMRIFHLLSIYLPLFYSSYARVY